MTLKRSLPIVLLVVLLVLSTVACTGAKPTSTPAASPTSGLDKLDPERIRGTQIKYYQTPGDWYAAEDNQKFLKSFSDKFGAEVVLVEAPADSNASLTKLVALIAAGESPDLMPIGEADAFVLPIKQIIQPVDDYIDLDHPLFDKAFMDRIRYKGKYYAFTSKTEGKYIIFNKTLFERNGVTTPLEYASKGEWTFDNFKKAAMEMTLDTNDDGTVDVWGFQSTKTDDYVIMNGGSVLLEDGKGGFTLNLTDPKVLYGLQFLQDSLLKDKYSLAPGWDWYSGFIEGKMAMISFDTWWCPELTKNGMKDEWDIAPMPYGPDGKADTVIKNIFGWSIPTGAKNPLGAGTFVTYMYEYYAEQDKNNLESDYNKYFTAEQRALIQKQKDSADNVLSIQNSIPGWASLEYNFMEEIMAGQSVSSVVDKYKAQFQALLDDMTKGTGLPQPGEFKGIPTEDFETGALVNFLQPAPSEGTPVQLTFTTDAAEVLDGRTSAKFVIPQAAEGDTWVELLLSDTAKATIAQWRNYTIKVDYRIVSAVKDNNSLYMQLVNKAGTFDGGYNSLDNLNDGDKGTFEITSGVAKDTTDVYLKIGVKNVKTIIIDNISITEAK